MIYTTHPCRFGYACIATEQNILCGVELDMKEPAIALQQSLLRFKYIKYSIHTDLVSKNDPILVERVISAIDEGTIYNLPTMFLIGTQFQKDVWNEIKNIPSGKTVSYKQLSVNIGKPKAFRAVATACKNNPIAIIIPCHRVVYSSGKDGNYRWGAVLKSELLNREYNK